MSQDEVREYIVKINNGSGCLIQPEGDSNHTYILTARHVVAKAVDEAQTDWEEDQINNIERYELDPQDQKWKSQQIFLNEDNETKYKLEPGINYFPHRAIDKIKVKDLVIIKVKKIPGLNSIIKYDIIPNDTEGTKGYSICGYPRTRNKNQDNEYRTDGRIDIYPIGDGDLREAEHPKQVRLLDLKGLSGGGILKYDGEKIMLAGIIKKMFEEDDKLGRFLFYPVSSIDEIIKSYNGLLNGIPDKLKKREPVTLEINEALNARPEIPNLIKKLKSQKILFDAKLKSGLEIEGIKACNKELFRISDIASITTARQTFIKQIGSTLLDVLLKSSIREQINQIINRVDTEYDIQLDFQKSADYSYLPWEYLFFAPQGKKPFFLAQRFLIRRKTGTKAINKPILPVIKVLIIFNNDLDLRGRFQSLENNLNGKQDVTEDVDGGDLKVDDLIENDDRKIHFTVERISDPRKLVQVVNNNEPNIIHVINNADELGREEVFQRLQDSISTATNKQMENRLFLLIQQSIQSPFAYQKDQYEVFDDLAHTLLGSGVPCIVSIPHSLEADDELFTISKFYQSIVQGISIGGSFFNLSKEILNKRSVAPPILYLDTEDFSFQKSKRRNDSKVVTGLEPRQEVQSHGSKGKDQSGGGKV